MNYSSGANPERDLAEVIIDLCLAVLEESADEAERALAHDVIRTAELGLIDQGRFDAILDMGGPHALDESDPVYAHSPAVRAMVLALRGIQGFQHRTCSAGTVMYDVNGNIFVAPEEITIPAPADCSICEHPIADEGRFYVAGREHQICADCVSTYGLPAGSEADAADIEDLLKAGRFTREAEELVRFGRAGTDPDTPSDIALGWADLLRTVLRNAGSATPIRPYRLRKRDESES